MDPAAGVLGVRIRTPAPEAPARTAPGPGLGGAGPPASAPRARAHSPAALSSRSRRRRPARSEVRPDRGEGGTGRIAQAPGLHFPKARGRDFLAQGGARPALPGVPRPALGSLRAPRAPSPPTGLILRGAVVLAGAWRVSWQ